MGTPPKLTIGQSQPLPFLNDIYQYIYAQSVRDVKPTNQASLLGIVGLWVQVSTGVDHGGTRGTSPPPEFGVGDASANCPPQIFVI